MKLSILIATLGQREERFKRLLDALLPQVDKYDDIEVIAYWNNFERPLVEIRQALLNQAKGEYVCFIDDDDTVPNYYCDEIMQRLDGVDYVGWQMQLYTNGEKAKPTYHSLRYSNWHDDEDGYYRNVSHLNPIKREIALKAGFSSKEGVPEDYDWANRVGSLVKTENYIDKVMYYYHHTADDSHWAGGKALKDWERPNIINKHFNWHPDSKENFSWAHH